jgi:diguanylate cyclase (GGDEF)-like protein
MRQSVLSILIVDEDEGSRRRIRTMLEDAFGGINVEMGEAANCSQTRATLVAGRYDIVLLGYGLYDRDGMELLRAARSLDSSPAIILLSERADSNLAVQGMKFGAADYLLKSKLTAELLRASIGYAIDVREEEARRKRAESELLQENRNLQQSVRELERRTRENSLLNELGAQLQICLTLEEAYRIIGHAAERLFPGFSGALYLLNPSRSLLESTIDWGSLPRHPNSFSPGECRALMRGRSYNLQDSHAVLVCQHVKSGSAGNTLCVPLAAQGETLGVLALQEESAGACASGEADALQQLAETVAEHIALSLANLKLRETLQLQSVRDPLTGLFNRRYMEESLEREVCSAVRRRRPLTVMMLDLDRFKTFNDSFGHEVGDRVLSELGRFLQSRTRGEDIACRYGGEEFVLILPEANFADGWKRAEQLREEFKTLRYLTGVESAATVTLSIGVASFPEHGPDARALLLQADRGLYIAKTGGRDRVAVAPSDGGQNQMALSASDAALN